MKLELKYKLEKACAEAGLGRIQLETVYLDSQKAVATDGRIMAIVPCEHGGEEQGKQLSGESLKAIRKAQGLKLVALPISVNGNVTAMGKGGETLTFKSPETQFPDYKQILPKKERTTKIKIGLDVDLLLKLADALGAQTKKGKLVYLDIEDETDAILVTAHNSPDALGFIMPIRASNQCTS